MSGAAFLFTLVSVLTGAMTAIAATRLLQQDKRFLSLSLFIGFSSFIHVWLPLLQYHSNFYRYQSSYEIWTHISSLLIYVFSLLVIYGAYRLTTPRHGSPLFATPESSPSSTVTLALLSTILIAVPALIASWLLVRQIESVGMLQYFRNRIFWRSDYGSIGVITKLMPAYGIIVTILLLGARGRIRVVLIGLLAAITLFWTYYTYRTGIRFELFSWLAAIMTAWLVSARRPPMVVVRRALVPIVLMGIVFTLGGELRANLAGVRSAAFSSETLVRGLNGAFGNHENVLWLTERKPEPTLGSSYLAMVTNFVPRALWANKPTGGGPILTNLIFPGSYKVGQAGASSITTGFLTEAIMNGGLIAVLLVSGGVGMVLRHIDALVLSSRTSLSQATAALLVLYVALLLVFSEWSQMAVQIGISAVALAGLALLQRALSDAGAKGVKHPRPGVMPVQRAPPRRSDG